jgi:hypothetical protein
MQVGLNFLSFGMESLREIAGGRQSPLVKANLSPLVKQSAATG